MCQVRQIQTNKLLHTFKGDSNYFQLKKRVQSVTTPSSDEVHEYKLWNKSAK